MADVGRAEREPARATAVNVAATAIIVRLSDAHRAKLVFVSTEYVFSGERGYYREEEPPSPTTHYGQTKWEAEQEVAKLAAREQHPADQHRVRMAGAGAGEISHSG